MALLLVGRWRSYASSFVLAGAQPFVRPPLEAKGQLSGGHRVYEGTVSNWGIFSDLVDP